MFIPCSPAAQATQEYEVHRSTSSPPAFPCTLPVSQSLNPTFCVQSNPTLTIDHFPEPVNMRYSIAFLGLVAFASTGSTSPAPIPDSTTTPSSDSTSCTSSIQTLMKPLAKDPWAKKFCATKFPDTVSQRDLEHVNLAAREPGTPLLQQLGLDEKDVLQSFCRCNFSGRGGRNARRKYRGRIARYVVEEDE